MKTVIGTTVRELRPMTEAEMKEEGWTDHRNEVLVMVLSNGMKLYPSRDYEGNGGGVWFGKDKDGAFAL
jgi:hypothetical protein